MANVTEINCGLSNSSENDDLSYSPLIQIDDEGICVVGEDDKVLVSFTQEELRGIMAIIAAHQDKTSLYIRAAAKNN
jgi:hypothetical protein